LCVGKLLREEKRLSRIDLVAIISHVLAVSKEVILMEPERTIGGEDRERIERFVRERIEGKPIAYLTGKREFYSREFCVDERVLIPRPETEVLIDEALFILEGREKPVRLLDVGTGSGIIGITLKENGADDVVCVDISAEAIAVARKNTAGVDGGGSIAFVVSDLLSGIQEYHSFDLICANLPYVRQDEYETLMKDVRCFEPRSALLGGADGMDFYRKLVPHAGRYLREGGYILCEIGSDSQAVLLGRLLDDAGFKVEIRLDLAGRQRVVRGLWTSSS
jgi:release factor glutamine methyltransferase